MYKKYGQKASNKQPMADELKNLGLIVNTKGINGNLVIVNCPKGIFLRKGCKIYIGFSENFTTEYTLSEDFFSQINKSELSLNEIKTKEQAQTLKEQAFFVLKSDILSDNEDFIFFEEIIDCEVFDIEKNIVIGKIVDIWELPANNVWFVETEKGNLPLPVIDDVIKEIDLMNKRINIVLIDGLMDLIG